MFRSVAASQIIIRNFQVEVRGLLGVVPCSVSVGYQRFGGPWCLHLQGENGWYPTATLHGVTTQKTSS